MAELFSDRSNGKAWVCGAPLSHQTTVGSTMDVGLCDYAKTPAKWAREGVTDVDESPTWVDVESNGVGFEDIVTSWTPLTPQDEINEKARLNFEVLKWETIRASGNWSDALSQVRDSMQLLISAQSQTEIRVGDPGAFGASVGVVNAFDGLRQPMELLEHSEQEFTSVPYADLVGRIKKINGTLVSLTSLDPWATETIELRRLIA
jgi:hypothetical protein